MPKPQLSLKGRALRYLSMREHSRSELALKLGRYAQEADDLQALTSLLVPAAIVFERAKIANEPQA